MQRQKSPRSIRVSRVLSLSLLVVMLAGLLKPEAAVQPVSFGAKSDFGTGNNPRSVAVGDFNGDGNLDVAVANANTTVVSILLGTGTGSFGPKTDFGTGLHPESVTVGDFNGDGKLDLAVANPDSNNVSILLGTGTGNFAAKTDFGTAAFQNQSRSGISMAMANSIWRWRTKMTAPSRFYWARARGALGRRPTLSPAAIHVQ